jgi:hypothetical protein
LSDKNYTEEAGLLAFLLWQQEVVLAPKSDKRQARNGV